MSFTMLCCMHKTTAQFDENCCETIVLLYSCGFGHGKNFPLRKTSENFVAAEFSKHNNCSIFVLGEYFILRKYHSKTHLSEMRKYSAIINGNIMYPCTETNII